MTNTTGSAVQNALTVNISTLYFILIEDNNCCSSTIGLLKSSNLHEGDLSPSRLCLYMVRVGDVLPPIMMDSVRAALCFGEVVHPPEVMLADISVTPVRRGDFSCHSLEVWEIIAPVVALTEDFVRVVPIVIAVAVRGKMHVTQRGPARVGPFVADKALP